MYYNDKLKNRFINERNNTVVLPNSFLEHLFERTSAMEKELGKDISSFTFYEILEFYKMLNSNSPNSIAVMNSQLSLYTQWCSQQNLLKDGQNHFLELKIEDFTKCTNKATTQMKILTRKEIYNWVDQLPNPIDQLILLGIFEGIKGMNFCELTNLKKEDFINNSVKLCTGRIINVSNKFLSIVDDCIEEDTYYAMSGKALKKMPLVDYGYIIKEYPNTKRDVSDFQNGRRIYNHIKRTMLFFDMYPLITANDISDSGKIDMIIERSKELNMSTNDYLFSTHIQEVENKYDCTIYKKAFMLKYEDYLV